MNRHHFRSTTDAARVLGQQLAVARRRQRRTAADVAERAGITRTTLRRIERGDPTVALGLFFDVAAVLSVLLFGREDRELAALAAHGEQHLALLPSRIRVAAHNEIDDDF